MKQAIS